MDRGHDHDHGGFIGWAKHTFAHLYDVHEKVESAIATHERGIWALEISLVGLGLAALFQTVIDFSSGSTARLANAIHDFGDAASLTRWIAFVLVRRGQMRRFTYGVCRAEEVERASSSGRFFLPDFLAAYESIRMRIDP